MQAQDTGELPKRSRYYSSMMAFLDYVGGKPAGSSDDSYVQQIDRAVRRAKKNAVWRKQYMDWEMEKKEIEWMALKKGRAEGEAKGRAETIIILCSPFISKRDCRTHPYGSLFQTLLSYAGRILLFFLILFFVLRLRNIRVDIERYRFLAIIITG